MAVHEKTTTAAMGLWRERWKTSTAVTYMSASATAENLRPAKTVAATVGMTGGMAKALNPVVHTKAMAAALGSAVVPKIKIAQPAVVGLGGGMARSMVYGETMAGDYPPLEWMDDLVDAPTVTMGGGFAKTVNSTNVIEKTASAAVGMTGGMGTVPRTHVKSVLAVVTLTTAQRPFSGPDGDARRSLRWINRERRRDTW